ncbi:MAG: aminotransferase class III-fold pyridoxal phosphate-dependent enzyme, partial [Chloroflexota bacterium]
IIVTAKGLSGGYAPLGAVLVSERIERTFLDAGQSFVHGYTYQAHPVACAAGLAVLRIIERENLIEAADIQGEYFFARLNSLKAKHPIVGDVRGAGLLAGIELVEDRVNRTPFDPSVDLSGEIVKAAFERGIMVYPCNRDAEHGDQFLISPPLIVTRDDIDEIVERLDLALGDLASGISA